MYTYELLTYELSIKKSIEHKVILRIYLNLTIMHLKDI